MNLKVFSILINKGTSQKHVYNKFIETALLVKFVA